MKEQLLTYTTFKGVFYRVKKQKKEDGVSSFLFCRYLGLLPGHVRPPDKIADLSSDRIFQMAPAFESQLSRIIILIIPLLTAIGTGAWGIFYALFFFEKPPYLAGFSKQLFTTSIRMNAAKIMTLCVTSFFKPGFIKKPPFPFRGDTGGRSS